MSAKLSLIYISIFSLLAVGCASSKMKERKEQREKLMQSAHLYCDFVNGEVYQSDVEVALNLEMAKKCDSEKPFSISQYRTPSENQGLIFCCSMAPKALAEEKKAEKAAAAAEKAKDADKSAEKKTPAKSDKSEKNDKSDKASDRKDNSAAGELE